MKEKQPRPSLKERRRERDEALERVNQKIQEMGVACILPNPNEVLERLPSIAEQTKYLRMLEAFFTVATETTQTEDNTTLLGS